MQVAKCYPNIVFEFLHCIVRHTTHYACKLVVSLAYNQICGDDKINGKSCVIKIWLGKFKGWLFFKKIS